MDVEPRALDIPQIEIVILYGREGNCGCPYHHRILLRRINEGSWVVLTPDMEREVEDLGTLEYSVIRRNVLFPEYTSEAGQYYHDPIEAGVLRQQVRAAREEAHIRGGEGEAAEFESQWRFSEPADARFNEIVEGEHLDDLDKLVELVGHGLFSISGVVLASLSRPTS